MKIVVKTFSFLALFTLTSVMLHAQEFYFGANTSLVAHAIAPQNNYGQRFLGYNLGGGAGLGAIGVVKFRNNHMIRFGMSSLPAGQNYVTPSLQRNIDLSYFSTPISYVYPLSVNKKTGSIFFLNAGLAFNFLRSAEVKHFIGLDEVSLYEFATHGINNPNERLIRSLLNENLEDPPARRMFNGLDVCLYGSLGLMGPVGRNTDVIVEFIGMMSLSDIRSDEWKIPHNETTNPANLNMFGGLAIGFVFRIE
jgi:hypothetical protein